MQARAENLIKIDERLHGLILPNYSLPQFLLEMTRRGTPLVWVQFLAVGRLRCSCHNISFTVVTRKTRIAITLQPSLLTEHRKLRQQCRSGIQAISYV